MTPYSTSAPSDHREPEVEGPAVQCKRRKSVQFDLVHNQQRTLPRDSGRVWKKLEKQICEKGLNSPDLLAFGDYFICERGGHAQVVVPNTSSNSTTSTDNNTIFSMDDVSLEQKFQSLTVAGNKPAEVHSILHYPKDNNMYIDWDLVDHMVSLTNSIPDDLLDTDFGIRYTSNQRSKHSKWSSRSSRNRPSLVQYCRGQTPSSLELLMTSNQFRV